MQNLLDSTDSIHSPNPANVSSPTKTGWQMSTNVSSPGKVGWRMSANVSSPANFPK
jgi:hypothetical protein